MDFNLDRYLARIGYSGPIQPDLNTLVAIHRAHVNAIPFEGFDPLLGRPVKLDMASLQEKLIDGRRGGYCFEQNAVLMAALEQIGFAVTGLAGRVRWMSPPDAPLGPRTHMLLKVDLPDGPYIADVGFGACLLDAPLRLKPGSEQRTAMGHFRLTEADGVFSLSAAQPDGFRVMYVFTLDPQIASDYELGNWYTSTSSGAPFLSMLIMERLAADKRYKLINTRFAIEARDGQVIEERQINSADELGKLLDQVFGITPPAPPAQIFERISG
jgi:N-hydroxyarylamine O-acetyltransferase